MPEWGNPPGVMPGRPELNQIGSWEATGGTETSKYPEEEKSTENPLVAASESGRAQTDARGYKGGRERNGLERPAVAGDSPVRGPSRPADPYPE